MALVVSFQNISGLADVSDYKVDVWINDTHIAGPYRVKQHRRADGWQKLVKQFANEVPVPIVDENFLITK